MNLTYLIDDSDQSLAPLLSRTMRSFLFNSVLIVSGVLLLFWPWQDLVNFISRSKVPLTFFQVFTVTLVILAYLHLRCGRGELMQGDYYTSMSFTEKSTFEKEHNFFSYTLVEFIVHSLLLLLPFLPLLILAASVSASSLLHFLNACAIVLATVFLCRLFGFFIYLLGGRFSSLGYFLSRIFFALYIFATITLAPAINPILNMYQLNKNLQNIGVSFENTLMFYATTLGASLLLILFNHALVVRHNKTTGIDI